MTPNKETSVFSNDPVYMAFKTMLESHDGISYAEECLHTGIYKQNKSKSELARQALVLTRKHLKRAIEEVDRILKKA
jgi:hypothetical protein